MKWHPSLGYFDEGFDLTAPDVFEAARQTFGQARVLHPVAYRSKAFADLEDEKIWTRDWVCVGVHERIPGHGDLLSYTVGNHGIHVQRDDKGQLQGRFNKAQHGGCRAIPLQCQTGKKTKCSFTSCGYSRDRDVISAAELNDSTAVMGQYLGFNPAKLVSIKVHTWGPFVFVNLDTEARPLVEQLDGLIDKIGCRLSAHRHIGRYDIEPACNWKIVGKTFLEGSQPTAAGNYADAIGSGVVHSVVDLANGYWSYEAGVQDGLLTRDDLPSLPAEVAADRRATFCSIYPNLLLALLSDHVVSWIMQPTDQMACLLHMDVFARESGSQMTPESKQRILAYWLEYTRGFAVAAETTQTTILNCAGPDAYTDSSTILNELPVESNYLAYCAQKYLIDRLMARHTYYWNDAYTNPKLAVSPSTRGAS
jgi:hypothetical protein